MHDSHGTLLRRRIALALAVAIACAGAGLGLASLSAGTQAKPRAPKAALRATPAPAHGHSRDVGARGLDERKMRALETATLGPEHAAEHAAIRRAQREPSADDVEPSKPVATTAAVGDELDPAQFGRWDASASVTFPIVAIHAVMLPTGKVMIFAFPQSPRQNSAQAWIWDPVTGVKTRKDPPAWLDPKDGQIKAANIWCSGHTFTADGELVVFGGNLEFESATSSWKGLNKVYTFNPFAPNGGSWQEQPDMRHGRWYPTGVRMADGRIPITSGLNEVGDLNPATNDMNEDVELFTPPAAPGGQGTVSLIGSTAYNNPSLPETGETYPHMFAMPSGRAMVVGPVRDQTWFLNTPGTTPWWTPAPAMSQRRLWGTAVPLPAGPTGSSKIMAIGGTNFSLDPSTNSTEVFDENNEGQGWQPAPSLNIGRGHANTVLLPDGSMVEVGGGVGRDNSFTESPQHAANPEQRQIELWDPQTGQWRLGPAQAENRAYHSTALLLPDGRVLSAGDEIHGGKASDLGEIYEPPYLFRGPRPTIGSAPQTIKVGAGFGVETPNTNIARATLVAPGSATHAVDMNQRIIPLAVQQRTGCVDLTAPPNAKVAPPGYYMLFLLNDQGVPSVAKFVKLSADGAAPGLCGTPPPPLDTTAPAVEVTEPAAGATISGSVDVTAGASDNVGVAGVRFKLDGQNLGSEDTTSPYSRTWNTLAVPNGTHELTAVARDAAGNTKTSDPVTVTVKNADITPPTVALTAPADGSPVLGTIDVVAEADDDEALADVEFKLDGQNLGTVAAAGTSGTYSTEWATRNASNGPHTLTAVAVDANDNRSPAAQVTVTVDNPPPPEEPPPNEIPPTKPSPPTVKPPVVTPPKPPPPNAAPKVSRLKLAAGKLSFRLSETATVKVTFERKRPGRLVGAARYARLRTKLTLSGKAGANSATFNARKRGFRAGSYRLTAVATDSSGKRSASVRAGFRVVALRRQRAQHAALIDGALARLGPFGTLS